MRRNRDVHWIGALTAVLLAVVPPLGAQRVGISPGDTVRIANASLPVAHGVVVAIAERELQLSVAGRTDVIPIGSDTRITVRRGRRPWGPVKGALLGTAASVALGLAWEGSDSIERRGCQVIYYAENGSPIYRCDKDARNMDEGWLATGALLGLTAGYMIRVPRWLDASHTIDVGVTRRGTMTMAVRLQ